MGWYNHFPTQNNRYTHTHTQTHTHAYLHQQYFLAMEHNKEWTLEVGSGWAVVGPWTKVNVAADEDARKIHFNDILPPVSYHLSRGLEIGPVCANAAQISPCWNVNDDLLVIHVRWGHFLGLMCTLIGLIVFIITGTTVCWFGVSVCNW